MTAQCDCGIGPAAQRRTIGSRVLAAARWVIPGSILAIMPKCPACLAAYIAIWTGLGVSVTTAAYARGALIALCVAALAGLAFVHLRRLVTGRAARRFATKGKIR